MNKSFFLALIAGLLLAGSASAQVTAANPAGTNGKVSFDMACIQAAVDARETAIIKAFTARNNAIIKAMETRKAGIIAAYGKQTNKERLAGITQAGKTFLASRVTINANYQKAARDIWAAYTKSRKACRGEKSITVDTSTNSLTDLGL